MTRCFLYRSAKLLAVRGGRFFHLYESLVQEGKIRADPRQGSVVKLLQSLGDQLESNPSSSRPSVPQPAQAGFMSGWFSKVGSSSGSSAEADISSPAIRGLYLVGGCGTGKTMLMDLFFANVDFPKKKRVHFHEYMIDVHARLFRLARLDPSRSEKCNTVWTASSAEAQRKSLKIGEEEPGSSVDLIDRVADELMGEAQLLCFDEFQVTFISDAVIMRRLFSVMFQRGLVVVATSNRPPDDLYLNGLNRELFMPFIPLLKKFCLIHHMDSETDYRASLSSGRAFFGPTTDPQASALLEAKFFNFARNDLDFNTLSIQVQGRSIPLRRVAKRSAIAWFTFSELCDKPLGSADYIAVAKRFHTVFIEEIPKLTLEQRDQVRRFITLIDAFYDQQTRLFWSSAAASLETIFTVDPATKKDSATDEVFAWDRTVSRLTEMVSEDYQVRHARTLPVHEFYGQFDLDKQLTPDEIHDIFVRFDENNDSVISPIQLNHMVNELAEYLHLGRIPMVSPDLLEHLAGSPEGTTVDLAKFTSFVSREGLRGLVENRSPHRI